MKMNIGYKNHNLRKSSETDGHKKSGGRSAKRLHQTGSAINTDDLTLTKTTDYVGNKIYEDGALKLILTDNGYFDYVGNKYYFYIQDHLGNNRVVTDQRSTIIQNTQYYPFGMAMGISTGQTKQPYKFGGKELDMSFGLNMYDYVARGLDPVTGQFTTNDLLSEKYPWISPRAFALNNPLRYTDPMGLEPTEKEARAIAAHVYGDNEMLLGGWKLSDRKFEAVRYENSDISFKSALYERTTDRKTEYTYAFAGTTFSDGLDWKANLSQPLGSSEQYDFAVENANTISQGLSGDELTFVGYSLGGGLAAASAYSTGGRAITFNAAGLSGLSISKYGQNGSAANIDAYITLTDPLNLFQTLFVFGALKTDGNRHYVVPKSIDAVYNGHSIDNMDKRQIPLSQHISDFMNAVNSSISNFINQLMPY
jgi:RHS repeat-associated protein